MKTSEMKSIAKELWSSARNSLDRFLCSTEAPDVEWRKAKNAHLDYLETRMKEIRGWINGEMTVEDIGPLADARSIFWDSPETPLQQEYCEKIFHLFKYLRNHSIGIQEAPTRLRRRT